MALRSQILADWLFANGDTGECLSNGLPVRLPHTWSVEEDGQYYAGKGWYKTVLPADTLCDGERAFLRFRGAYRDTTVFVNGQEAGRHLHSGYTPFIVEITGSVKPRQENTITVCVDNGFSEAALPCGPSFDWANDGGLYRPAELWVTGPAAVRDMEITARPVILPTNEQQHRGQAIFGFRAFVSSAQPGMKAHWELYRGAEDSMTDLAEQPFVSGTLDCGEEAVLPPAFLSDIVYWHFDRPELYTLRLSLLLPDGTLSDSREWVIGFRELRLQGAAWFLNGEKVRLPGMEWMPGSDPDIGMAEPREQLERMLRLLRESNSVLTRFHWQQDDWVYDWCDRHGLLVQEELPFWGKQPEGDPEKLWPAAKSQLEEMIAAHRHHPSVIAWGVGNELSGQEKAVQRYVRKARAYAGGLDATRPVSYVTNTAWRNDFDDAVKDGDILCVNDYIGTWHQGLEQEPAWESLLAAHPGRAFIPSEFGLCEPAFPGGDKAREKIFLDKMTFYRSREQIVGTVYFCLNDYRTHMGEEGSGRLRRRVHGSADLYGAPKPSYFTVQREYAPLAARHTEKGLLLACRGDIPCYSVCGYILQSGETSIRIPDLKPGESWLYEGTTENGAVILRPNGDFVLTV